MGYGTQCSIGILNKNGTVSVISCKYDGYLGHAGRLLLTYYYKSTIVRELINNGNLVSLDRTIGECNYLPYVAPVIKDSIDFTLDSGIEIFYLFNQDTNNWKYKEVGSEYKELTKEIVR